MNSRGLGSRRLARALTTTAGVAVMAAAATPALAEIFTSSNLTFVAVRDAGNRGATTTEAPLWPTWAPPLGAVDHEFGIMRTNVTNGEWIEFVRAYAPHYQGSLNDPDFIGHFGIQYTNMGGTPHFSLVPGQELTSIDVTWRIAAHYANWLHNDKGTHAAAFENGAYDTSTFGEITVGGQTLLTDQFTHNPGARFWIPTVDEYTKAAHWDPDKHGPGQGGYWLMPDGGDENLVAGPPGVGESAGDWWPGPLYIPTGLYPDTQSPWGMIDVSSTYEQHTEGYVHPLAGVRRLARGSNAGSSFYWNHDRIDRFGPVSASLSNQAIRIATAIPGPASVAVLGLAGLVATYRRRTTWLTTGSDISPSSP